MYKQIETNYEYNGKTFKNDYVHQMSIIGYKRIEIPGVEFIGVGGQNYLEIERTYRDMLVMFCQDRGITELD